MHVSVGVRGDKKRMSEPLEEELRHWRRSYGRCEPPEAGSGTQASILWSRAHC